MEIPAMLEPRTVAADTQILPASCPIPGLGVLPVNAFLIRSSEPVLVDTGFGAVRDAFMETLRAQIDPQDIRWIWLTHTDADHVGSLRQLLEEAPRARLITTFLGMGKLGLLQLPIPPERVYLLNPGQTLEVGDHQLLAVKPPCYDAPETTGLYDVRSGALFTADCFGTLMREVVAEATELSPAELREGLITWATVDSPWISLLDGKAFGQTLQTLRQLEPRTVLSGHLSPAPGMLETLLRHLDESRGAAPFVGPDQDALRRMLEAA